MKAAAVLECTLWDLKTKLVEWVRQTHIVAIPWSRSRWLWIQKKLHIVTCVRGGCYGWLYMLDLEIALKVSLFSFFHLLHSTSGSDSVAVPVQDHYARRLHSWQIFPCEALHWRHVPGFHQPDGGCRLLRPLFGGGRGGPCKASVLGHGWAGEVQVRMMSPLEMQFSGLSVSVDAMNIQKHLSCIWIVGSKPLHKTVKQSTI